MDAFVFSLTGFYILIKTYSLELCEITLVSGDKLVCVRVRPLLESRAQIFLLGAKEGLKLFAQIKVRDSTHFFNKIV